MLLVNRVLSRSLLTAVKRSCSRVGGTNVVNSQVTQTNKLHRCNRKDSTIHQILNTWIKNITILISITTWHNLQMFSESTQKEIMLLLILILLMLSIIPIYKYSMYLCADGLTWLVFQFLVWWCPLLFRAIMDCSLSLWKRTTLT